MKLSYLSELWGALLLCTLKRHFQHDLNCPRKSKNWYLSNVQYPSSIPKSLKKLPRTKLFLEIHSETVSLYQCRRLLAAKIALRAKGYPITRWRLLLASRLNNRCIKEAASSFLERILLTHGKVPIKKSTK